MSEAENTQAHAQQITETPDLGGGAKRGDLMDAVKDILAGGDQGDQGGGQQTELMPTGEPDDQGAAGGEGEPIEGRLSEDGLGMQPTGGGDGGDSEPAEGSLAALAEKAGVDLDALYATEITLPDELGTLTIGALKDNAQQYARFETERDAFEETRNSAEAELIRAQAELQEVVGLLPEIKPEILQAAQQKYAESMRTERLALFRIRPDWKEPETFARVQNQIADTLAEYGFSAAEAASFYDHRATKLLHDFHVMRERFRAANETHRENLAVAKQNRTQKGQPDAGANARKQNQQQNVKRQLSRPEGKLEAVKDILNGALDQ